MKNDEGLDFALSRTTGRMVDIRMVERGLACGCVCPNCGSDLQARKGRRNRHHFAHHVAGRGRPTCEGGRESTLHRTARQIIAGWQSIELPAKRERLQGCRVSTLEFDLSQMHRSAGWNLASLELGLRTDTSIRHWVFHVGEAQLRQRLQDELHEAETLRGKELAESQRGARTAPDVRSEIAADEVDLAVGEMVFHPALGLIPKDPAKRLVVLSRAYPEPKVFHLARAIAFLRHHPHGDRSCLVTFGSSGPGSRTSEYDAALSEFARTAGLHCVYFGIAESRLLRGENCYECLDQFLTALQTREGMVHGSPSVSP